MACVSTKPNKVNVYTTKQLFNDKIRPLANCIYGCLV